MDTEGWQAVIDTDLSATFFCIQAALPMLATRPKHRSSTSHQSSV